MRTPRRMHLGRTEVVLAARFLSKAQGCPWPRGAAILLPLHLQSRLFCRAPKHRGLWVQVTLHCAAETGPSPSGQDKHPAQGLGQSRHADRGLAGRDFGPRRGSLSATDGNTGQQGPNITVSREGCRKEVGLPLLSLQPCPQSHHPMCHGGQRMTQCSAPPQPRQQVG